MYLNRLQNPFLRERITLQERDSLSTANGNTTITNFSCDVWASITPIKKTNIRYASYVHGLGKNIVDRLYKVIIRNNSSTDGFFDSVYQKTNTLCWKKEEFELLFPFSFSDQCGVFLESLCLQKGGSNG
ncbi:MAG: hypothetical protein LBF84_03060 [Holosporales bacterium]|jgi:hypothetical protein|nr:hypothetical protein [Holosporales bacterium]